MLPLPPVFLLLLLHSLSPPSCPHAAHIKIGALLTYGSVIGDVGKQAFELAVSQINGNDSLLSGFQVDLLEYNTNCSAFVGAATGKRCPFSFASHGSKAITAEPRLKHDEKFAAIELLKNEVVAIVGPQSSAVSHSIAYMGTATQVPLVSFAATDPSFSGFEYPYFFRVAHSDAVQMQAIASFIGYYQWRQVVAICSDDDFGNNGVAALSDALVPVGSELVMEFTLVPSMNETDIGSVLLDLSSLQSRVVVVHMPQSLALRLFAEAKYLGMMSAGYVWIVSDSTIGTLESKADEATLDSMEGVVGMRGYYSPDSPLLKSLLSDWMKNTSIDSSHLPIYGLYAYDSMWAIAYALDNYLKRGNDIRFKEPTLPPNDILDSSELAHLKVFEGGESLRTEILQTRFSGSSGLIEISSKGDLIRSEFEIVNIVGGEFHVIGYWTNETKLTLSPPGTMVNESLPLHISDSSQSTFHVVWPGDMRDIPQGWVIPRNGKPLRIAVTNRTGFAQFISWSANSSDLISFHGFCIDVFQTALKYLPYAVPYTFVLYGQSSTAVDDMIQLVADNAFDAVVGDITITTKRLEKVDFTQPYTQSGLVVLVMTRNSRSAYALAFLEPFTPALWLTILAFLLFTGFIVWILEHKHNEDFHGHTRKQIGTVLWFTFSTVFFSHNETTRTLFGRFVLIIWLFTVLIITSSYTANLTSVLTVRKLVPSIESINDLQAKNVPVGYRAGSYVKDYLISINIAENRLVPLYSTEDYARALRMGPNNGGVAAIVDTLITIQAFLETECGYMISGQEFTKDGWGFAFPKDSQLAVDLSKAILTMSQDGQLQRIHDLWIKPSMCNSQGNEVDSSRLSLDSFWGLFLLTGIASTVSLIVYIFRLLWRFSHQSSAAINASPSMSSRGARFIKSFASYIIESHSTPNSPLQRSSSRKMKRKASEAFEHAEDEHHPL